MASRLELQSKLEELLGSRNVYYQPPIVNDILGYSIVAVDIFHLIPLNITYFIY